MPNEDFDNDAAGITEDGGKQRRGPAESFLSNLQKKNAEKQGAVERTAGLDKDGGKQPALSLLPTGTAHQVERLFAKRQQRLQSLFIRLALFVLLPTFIVWFYAALIATPRYVCNFEITYQAYEPTTTLSAGLIQSDQGSSSLDDIDYGTLLYEYIRSQTLAEKVGQQIGFRDHFSSGRIDGLSRLSKNATQQEFLDYWRNRVSASEGFGGYVTVQVEGFDPAFTLLLAQTINADADQMIDGLNAQARDSEIKSANNQLRNAAAELKDADNVLTLFRNTHGDLDPSFAATQLATIIGTLESQLAMLKAQLQWANANMQPNNTQIVQLKLQVSALEQQIASERQRLSDTTTPSYSDTVSQYEDLLADQQFASTDYQSAQQGLIIAQADADSKQNYAVDFVAPVLPDQPTLPDPLLSSLTTFLVFLSLYGISNLLFAAFRDQSGV